MSAAYVLPLSLLVGIFCTVCVAALPVDERPAGPGEWGYRPFDGKLSAVDPPGFVWRPQKDAATYELQVARDANFSDVVYDAKGLTLYCNCPPKTFGPGSFWWRFRYVTKTGEASDWSTARRFTIDASSKPFPCPTREDILARIPATHPRLFLRPEDVPRFKELAAGRLKPQWDGIIAACEKILKSPPDITEPPLYPPDVKRGENDEAWRQIWWGNRTRVEATCGSAATLAFAYLLGGDERYAAEARRLILAACAWDPKGATGYRYNDEAGMPFAYLTSRTYTWLYHYLSEEDRAKIRACMKIRGEEMYNHLMGKNHIWAPYDSHANRAWHKLGEVGTAFYGEIPGAEDWVWFAMNKFWCAYPVWNDDFGGWHEGISYWTGYLTKVTWWLATLKATYGIDGFQKPFFSCVGNFPLYVVPPGENLGGYGDLSAGFTARNCSPTLSIFARMAQNPYWEWVVENSGGAELPGGYMGFIYGTTEKVPAKPPTDLPSSVLFPGIGVAVLRNDLVNRANDVAFMLKASPMGSQSHGYDAQNSFLLSVAGDPVFIASGKRDLYGSPHHSNWMWETKSTNCILVDGKGQDKHTNRPQGEITRFATSRNFDYVVGEAAAAYGGRLKRFTRAVVFIKPGTLVMFDTLQAPQPATFQWLLHSNKPMDLNGQTVIGHGDKHGAVCQLVAPGGLALSQTDKFDPPPQSWVKLTQYHLTAATTEPQADVHFISVLRAFREGQQPPILEAREIPAEGAVACEVDLPAGKAIVLWRDAAGTGTPIRAAGVTSDGEVACVLLDAAGKVSAGFCQGGSLLTYQGAPVKTQ